MPPVPLTSPLKNAVAGDGGLQPPRDCRITHGPHDSCFEELRWQDGRLDPASWRPSFPSPTMPRLLATARNRSRATRAPGG